jgi:hypothetical protein
MYNIITSKNPKSLFKTSKIPSSDETKTSDYESIERYTTCDRNVHRNLANLFWQASQSANTNLGLSKGLNVLNPKFKPLSVSQSVKSAINDSNAGSPTFKKKNTKVAINDATNWLNKVVSTPNVYSVFKNILLLNPKTLFHRFQLKLNGDTLNVKIRQVWCESFRIIVLENYFFRQIIDTFIEYNRTAKVVTSSSGLRNVQISNFIVARLRLLIGTSKIRSLYSLDYSKYDASIPDFFIDLYFFSMLQFLDLNQGQTILFNLLRYYTKFGPIIYEGKLYFKRKGISSGSLLTNHFDSWLNFVLQYVSKRLSDLKVPFSDIRNGCVKAEGEIAFRHDNAVTGDDAMMYTTEYEVLTLQELCKYLGMELSIKSKTNDPREPIFFLGRYWDYLAQPFQTEAYMSAHICFRTKFYKKNELDIDISDELAPSRILSICCPFSNGMQYIQKTFNSYEPLEKLLSKEKFIYLKDYPREEKNLLKSTVDIYNWRQF